MPASPQWSISLRLSQQNPILASLSSIFWSVEYFVCGEVQTTDYPI
jgi:hypothetical protein